MISRTHLRQFLAVVDTGNFTRAAAQVNVAQPTLSAGIAELERRLGATLFTRQKRRIQLTEAGNRLLAHARRIERDFQLAEANVTGAPAPIRPIKLGVLLSFSTALLEKAIGAYDGAEPIEIIEGSERELTSGLSDGRIDVAVTLLRASETRFAARSLFRERYRLALPRHHALADALTLDPEQVAGETMIARRSCELLAETSRFFTEHGARPPFSLRSANDDRVMAMVRAGLGITVAPESLQIEGTRMPKLTGFDREREIGLVFAANWAEHYAAEHALVSAFDTVMSSSRTRSGIRAASDMAHP